MKKKIVLALFLAFSMQVFSQGGMIVENKQVYIRTDGLTTTLPKQKTAPKGSVYLSKDWLVGTIILKDSTYISDYPFKYNVRSKFVEIKEGADNIKILSANRVSMMLSQGTKGPIIYKNASEYIKQYPELGACDFIQIMANGQVSLIDKLTMDMVESNYNAAMDAGETSDKYYVVHTYYIIKDGTIHKIKKNKKSILKILNDKETELATYIKTNKIRIKEPFEIAKVVNYYNSLHEKTTN